MNNEVDKYFEIKPVSPVIPKLRLQEIEIAKNQPQYRVLPSVPIFDKNKTIITRWRFPLLSRLILLFTGNLYIEYMTFGQPVTPLYLSVEHPMKTYPDLLLDNSISAKVNGFQEHINVK